MPSKHSERLKQAIDYIRSGEKEIAREIILEIIQADPDYEKAWIWLVETVPDRANKVDILKTRLEQYPETSPFSRIALDKIAPEVLDTLVPASEAIIYPPGMEPRSEATEDEIQYNVSIDHDDHDQFRLDDDELIQFEEPKASSPFETSDSKVLHEIDLIDEEDTLDDLLGEQEDDLFTELPKESPGEEDVEFNLFNDIEGEEIEEQDLDFFLENEKDVPASPASSGAEEEVDFESWLDDATQNEQQAGNVDELANLLDDVGSSDDAEENLDDQTDDYGIFGIQDDSDSIDTGASNPFILDEDSKQILGSDVVDQVHMEEQSLDELFRGASTGDLTPSTDFLGSSDFPEFTPDTEPGTEISSDDISAASDNFRDSVLAESISHSGQREKEISQVVEKKQEKTRSKKKKKNATFVFGCSMMAAMLFVSLIAMGYIVLKQANNPVYKAITITPTFTSTVTSTPTVPAVAPWLQDEEETVEQTPDPNDETEAGTGTKVADDGEEDVEPTSDDVVLTLDDVVAEPGLNGRTLQEWIDFFEQYKYECNLLEGSGDNLYQLCEYLDDDHDIIAQLYGTEAAMPTRIEFQVLAMKTEELESSDALEALITDTLAPVVIEPVANEFKDDAWGWFVEEASNLVTANRNNEISKTFGEITITIEYSDYFLRIEL